MAEVEQLKESNFGQGQSQWEFKHSHALVIGIDKYQNDITPLKSAVNDAAAIADVLETQHHYQVTRLFNEAATLDRLKTELKALSQKIPKDDRLLFYFAGHGIARKSDNGPAGYLMPQNAKLADPNTLLSMHALYEALCQLEDCRHLLVILDCCFAGTFRWANTRKAITLDVVHREHYDRFIQSPAWEVLTSTASDQEALDAFTDQRGQLENSDHSPFANALIEALKSSTADYTGDQVMTVRELYVYLDDEVAKLTQERQTPGYFPLRQDAKYEKGKYIFTFAGFDRNKLTPAPQLEESQNPYRGLKSFEERHADFFFGRDQLIDALSKRLSQANNPLVTVLGASGAGKSSLVKAGLVADLRKQNQWYILDPIRPGVDPFNALARAMLPLANPGLLKQVAQLKFLDQSFRTKLNASQSDLNFVRLAKRWNYASDEARLLIAIDCLPQLLPLCSESEQQQLLDCRKAVLETLNRLLQALQQNPATLNWQLEEWSRQHPDTKLLLVIDQFEELITLNSKNQSNSLNAQIRKSKYSAIPKLFPERLQKVFQDSVVEVKEIFTDESAEPLQNLDELESEPDQSELFLKALSQALAAFPNQLRVVLTLRSDFESRFQNSALQTYWQASRFPVRPMTSDELRLAIEGPALKQALYFDPAELVGQLMDEVGQTPGALPLLSFTLSELYAKLHQRWCLDPDSTERALKQADYQALGGIAGALAQRAKEEYSSPALDQSQRIMMREAMLRMVSIEGSSITRRRVPISELDYPTPAENASVEQVLNRLVNARLLVRGQENDVSYIEPTHDVLVRGWAELQQWIRQNQELITIQRRLTPAAEEWQKLNRPTNYLWNAEPRLPLLAQVLKSKNSWLNRIEAEFVKRSIQRRTRNKRIRQGAIALIFVLLLGISTYVSLQLQPDSLFQQSVTCLKTAASLLP